MVTKKVDDLKVWRVEQLRCTVFTESLPQKDDFLTWEKLVGSPPDQSSLSPKLSKGEEVGKYEKGQLILTYVPNRIDLHYVPQISSEEDLLDFPNIGPIEESLGVFVPLISNWLNSCQPIIRLAFGLVVNRPAGNHEDAYKLLNKYLHDVKVDSSTSDFLYQINKKRLSKSGIKDLIVNRLSTWQAVKLMIKIEKENIDTLYACRSKIDINTHQDNQKILPKDQLLALFDEFVQMGIEIVAKGTL